ncbi:hypothetical protein [Hyphomicrobium sp.]|uniref:hypothetical protein n=1 Tax=Hyphomicrobium sp. TaxID=82 RepID=UPI002FE1E3BF
MQYCNGAEWVAFPKAPLASCPGLGPWTVHTSVSQEMGDYGWNAMAYGNGVFVAVGAWNYDNVLVSPDGINWTAHVVTPGDDWRDVTFGNGMFVAVGFGGNIRTSTDGVNWTARTSPAANEWRAVTYGDGRFVAVGSSGANRVMTSTDGISWTDHAATAANEWTGVTYGNGLFVATARSGPGPAYVMTSTNGTAWTARPGTGGMEAVTFGNGRFVGVVWGVSYTSTNGTSWTAHNGALTNLTWRRVIYANGRFIATTSYGVPNEIVSSVDGVTWQDVPKPIPISGLVAYGDNRVVIMGGAGPETSLVAFCGGTGCENPEAPGGALVFNGDHRVVQWCDGTTWQAAGPVDPPGPNSGTCGGGHPTGFLAFNGDSCILQYCDGDNWRGIGELNSCACDPDAGTWTTHSIGEAGNWRGIAYGNGTFVAMAHSPATSGDGINWTVQSGSPAGSVSGAIAFGNNLFVVPSQGGWTRDVWTSPDGINWTTHNNSLPPSAPSIQAVTYGGGQFVGVGNDGAIITSSDGINWTERSSTVTTGFTDIAYGNGRYVAVGGWGVPSHPVVTSTDAVNWTAVPSASVFNSRWNSVAYGNGLFVAKSYGGGPHFMYSSDGENWQAGNSGTYGTHWGGEFISFGNGLFVVAGAVGAGPSDRTIYTSSDGINWSLQSGPGQAAIKRATYANGMFVGVNDGPSDMTVRATCLGGG